MKWKALGLFLIALSFVLTIHYYLLLPEKIAIHWNIEGPNNYANKVSLFFFLSFLFVLWLLFLLIPRMDSLKRNIKNFQKVYEKFCILIIGFMFYIIIFVIYTNLYTIMQIHYFVIPAVSIVLYVCGELCKYAKRNRFIGIRTPWTLSSNYVWKKTHKQGEKLFKFSSFLLVLALVIDYFTKYEKVICFSIFLIISIVVYLVVYSYLVYTKKKR